MTYPTQCGGFGIPGPTGPTGPAGPAGVNGRTVLSGPTPPTPTLGSTGDFYIQLDSGGQALGIYGPKDSVPNIPGWPPVPTPLQGPAGPQGDSGAPGPPGPSGSFLESWQGTWSAATAYAAGDLVFHGTSSYLATTATTAGIEPPAAPWTVVAQGA